MSKYYYTSDEIIKSVKRRIQMPTSQVTFSEQDLLDFATEEMNLAMVPMVQKMQENYFLYTVTIPLEANKVRYAIPYRATGNKIRDVAFQPVGGNVSEMTQIQIEDLPFYNQSSNNVYSFYIANNEICLVAKDTSFNTTGNLMISFYIRPNTLVPLSEVGVITTIDTTLGIVTLNEVPVLFDLSKEYDFYMVKSPHKIYTYDNKITSVDVNLKTLTFGPGKLPSGLSVGDHVSLSTECAIPQIPSDLHVVLAHRTAARCLEALGDTEGLQNANQKLAEMQQASMDLIDDRVESAPKKVINRRSLLRGGLSSRRFRG